MVRDTAQHNFRTSTKHPMQVLCRFFVYEQEVKVQVNKITLGNVVFVFEQEPLTSLCFLAHPTDK